MAFAVQNEGRKINHALVLGGSQGIGKDTVIIAPLKCALGEHNFNEISPKEVVNDKNNAYLRCRLLRISEAKDAKGEEKYLFYEQAKTIITSPPEYHSIQDKFIPRHQIPNVNNTIITTNYRSGGLYVPRDDRRYFIVFSDVLRDQLGAEYWRALDAWMAVAENVEEIAAWLMVRDVSHFNPKAPPPRTAAWHEMAEGGQSGETNQLADLVEGFEVFTVAMLAEKASTMQGADVELGNFLRAGKNGTKINRMLNDLGWTKIKNQHDNRGRWLVSGSRVAIYGPDNLPMAVKLAMVANLLGR
jgi:hypothetical protein